MDKKANAASTLVHNTQRAWIALLPLLVAGCLEASASRPADQAGPADDAASQGQEGSDADAVQERQTITRNRRVVINGVECNDGTEERTLLQWNMPQEPPATSGTTTYEFPPRVTAGTVYIERRAVVGNVQITIADAADEDYFTFESRGIEADGVNVKIGSTQAGANFVGRAPGTHTLSYGAVGAAVDLTLTVTATVCL